MNSHDCQDEQYPEIPIGYICPDCGNEISFEESNYGEAILCIRCPHGEYTTMEPVYEEEND